MSKSGLGVTSPVGFADPTLPKVGLTLVTPTGNAAYSWAADNVAIGPVSSWYDTVGAAALVAPTPPSQKPVAMVDPVSGRKVVRFNGVDQRMDIPMDLAGAKTLVVVGKLNKAGFSQYLVTGGGGPSFNLYNGGSGKWTGYVGASLASTVNGDTNWHVFIMVSNGASSVLSVDGVESVGNAGTFAPNNLRLAASGTYFACDFHAVEIHNYAADATQRAGILASMKTRYNL